MQHAGCVCTVVGRASVGGLCSLRLLLLLGRDNRHQDSLAAVVAQQLKSTYISPCTAAPWEQLFVYVFKLLQRLLGKLYDTRFVCVSSEQFTAVFVLACEERDRTTLALGRWGLFSRQSPRACGSVAVDSQAKRLFFQLANQTAPPPLSISLPSRDAKRLVH